MAWVEWNGMDEILNYCSLERCQSACSEAGSNLLCPVWV